MNIVFENERKEIIKERIRKGHTYAAIGKDLGISRQRVHQILGASRYRFPTNQNKVHERALRTVVVTLEQCMQKIDFLREDIAPDQRSKSVRLHELYLIADQQIVKLMKWGLAEKTETC